MIDFGHPIPGHSGLSITKEGVIYTRWRGGKAFKKGPIYSPRILKASVNSSGYKLVVLQRPKKNRYVHELVLLTYRGSRPGGFEARHLNGNHLDNRLENLSWGTRSDNEQDKIKHGTNVSGERHWKAHLTRKKVEEIRRRREAGETITSLGKAFNINHSHVSKIVLGKVWK